MDRDRAVKDFKSQVERELSALTDGVDQLLWHYTTAGGLDGIVRERVLRATNIAFLNDRREFLHGRDLLAAVVADIKTSDASSSTFLDQVSDLVAIWTFLEDTWVTSFSSEPDDLSQWRSYGGHADRYCIGLDSRQLCHLKAIPEQNSARVMGLYRVEYQEDKQRRLLSNVLRSAIDLSRTNLPPGTVAVQLCRVFPLLKHPAFHGEREWRLYVVGAEPGDVACFESGGTLKPYIRLCHVPVLDPEQLPIKKIYALSSSNTARAADAARYLTRAHDLAAVDVEESDVPFVG